MSGSRDKQGAAYVRALYEPDEHFALLAVGRVPGFETVKQRIVTAARSSKAVTRAGCATSTHEATTCL